MSATGRWSPPTIPTSSSDSGGGAPPRAKVANLLEVVPIFRLGRLTDGVMASRPTAQRKATGRNVTAAFGAIARRRRKRDERQRPTQRAVMSAGGGARPSPSPRRRLALELLALTVAGPVAGGRGAP